jgi:hypothetical protein
VRNTIVDFNPPANPEQRRIYKRGYTLINKLVEDVTTTVTHGDQYEPRGSVESPAPVSPTFGTDR